MTVVESDVNAALDEYFDKLGSYLEHKGFSDPEIDLYFLEHHGVKGMKWGQRRARNKQLNRASRANDRAANKVAIDKQRAKIDKARASLKKGTTKAGVKKAKANYKANKAELGSREAKKIIRKAKQKHFETQQVANQIRDGKELAGAILIGVAAETLRARA
jgi:hypothetical protein